MVLVSEHAVPGALASLEGWDNSSSWDLVFRVFELLHLGKKLYDTERLWHNVVLIAN